MYQNFILNKKIVKNILVVIILVAIIGIIPIILYNQASNATNVVNKVDGTEMVGISGYFNKIASDSNTTQEIKDNAINIVVERIVKIHGNS